MSSDLVEKVARVLDPEAFESEWDDKIQWARDDAKAAIAVVLQDVRDWEIKHDFSKSILDYARENGVSLDE